MKGDFSRFSFDPAKHFSRVLMQQGRVQLDSDFNEQTSILLRYLRKLAADIIGPYGGPVFDCGFAIVDQTKLSSDERERLKKLGLTPAERDFLIGKGRYYVDGVMCENEYYSLFSAQPDYTPGALADVGTYLVYLDVYERHVSAAEDDLIREAALGGPDTASRAKIVWQVKTIKVTSGNNCSNMKPSWDDLMKSLQPDSRGRLRARARQSEEGDYSEPCIISPESRYRGAENQLYRVEIHYGSDKSGKPPTFKWSRENGAVEFIIKDFNAGDAQTRLTVENIGRDDRFGLKPGDWVELQHEDLVDKGEAQPLLQVASVDPISREVTLDGTFAAVANQKMRSALLRRWDQKEGAVKQGGQQLTDGSVPVQDETWLNLEDGIQIRFGAGATYRTGDYWLIPARTATGDVIWPGDASNPLALAPHGVKHRYAPLAIIRAADGGTVSLLSDCRCKFAPACLGYGYYDFDDYMGIGPDNFLIAEPLE